MLHGYRQHKTFIDVLEGEVSRSGAFLYSEVTNNGPTDVLFYPDDLNAENHRPPNDPIPILSGETRAIPRALYRFTASGPVTVVSYGS